MTAVFVTATGTGVGKTFVAVGLIRHFRSAGRAVDAIKPVVSGFDGGEDSDPARLLAALGRSVTAEEIARMSPWRFRAPLSPDMAARQEQRLIPYAEVVEFCRAAVARSRTVLVIEGIGGIMVPLDERHSVLDLMSLLRVPIVLVAGSYVGTISHTLTSLEVLARRNLDVTAVVVSESEDSAASLADTVATVERFADSIDIIGLPRLPPGMGEHPAFARLAALL